MKKQEKYCILLLIIFFVIIIGCSNDNVIEGKWENDERIIIFEENNFEIDYKNTEEIKAFKGIYESNNNHIIMRFLYYKNNNEIWKPLENTTLAGHVERIKYKINGRTLETIILNTGKKYIYQRNE